MSEFQEEIERLIRNEGLDDLRMLLTPREWDEVPLATRRARLRFLSSLGAREQSRILVGVAVKYLGKILAYVRDENRGDVVAMVSVLHFEDLDAAPPEAVIPNFWVCTNAARDLPWFRMQRGATREAALVREWVASAGLSQDYEVFDPQPFPTDDSLRRVYIVHRDDAATQSLILK